jgi:MFS family permease
MTGAAGSESDVEREVRSPRAAGIAGLAFAVLFALSFVLMRHHPDAGSSAAEIEVFYLRTNVRRLAIVGLYLAPFAGIAFLWFIAVIRDRVGSREDRFFATAFLGSGLLFVAMFFGAAAAASAPLVGVKFQDSPVPSPDVVVFARGLAYTLLYIYAMRAAAVFIVVVSTIALRTDALPRWLAFVGYAIAVALFFGVGYAKWIVLLFPAWVAAVSVVILLYREELERDGPVETPRAEVEA